jgi:hypothetical protein
MSGSKIKHYQITTYMDARRTGCSRAQAAKIARISSRSARRIEAGQLQPLTDRHWRTRPDPLSAVWMNELEPMLVKEPQLTPVTLYEYLTEKYPGQYQKALRTLQRRVCEWKSKHVQTKEVMFPQRHEPGVLGLSDFTKFKQETVTIGGKPLEHLFYHYRLAYSGWQYVQIVQGGESFVSLSSGLQNALSRCGGSPQQHRSDSLSAAYINHGGRSKKKLTQFYEELCQHYQLEATRNNVGVAHENGSIESPHGYFKRRLHQKLLLRGSVDFISVTAYQEFIQELIDHLNSKCSQKFQEEQAVLNPLPRYRYPDYEEVTVKVTTCSTITVRCILYSVPSRLIGQQLTIHLHSDCLIGYLRTETVFKLGRCRDTNSQQRRARCIDYRHLVDSLRKKPRAFLGCLWQQDILPNEQWRTLWQRIRSKLPPEQAARLMVEALYFAAQDNQQDAVAEYLEEQLVAGIPSLSELQQYFMAPITTRPTVTSTQHSLDAYDQFLPSRVVATATSSTAPSTDASPPISA